MTKKTQKTKDDKKDIKAKEGHGNNKLIMTERQIRKD
jgi:hypothetical protein